MKAQADADTPEIRAALLVTARDENDFVRSEALVGLASRDRKLALPLVIDALKGEAASVALFQAAGLVADARLVEHLVPRTDPSGDEWIDR